jgi:NADPH:quinone reductase-like Zn-dependent oxidoreductase
VITLFNQGHLAGSVTAGILSTGLGGSADGTLREYAALSEQGLVHIPTNLDFNEAATLPCAAVTAWNALYGLESRSLKPGQTVLTQGTGGVSIFALQFAKAAGARVIATTSSDKKAEQLKKLGADHVINYKENPNWGEQAKNLTPNGLGVEHVVEVGGPTTLAQSLKAIAFDGVISKPLCIVFQSQCRVQYQSTPTLPALLMCYLIYLHQLTLPPAIIGFIGGFSKDQPTFLDCLNHQCTVRGVLVGSRLQFEAMNAAIEQNNIHPVVDEKVFELADLKDAYQYMFDQKHFGKLCVKIA